MDEFEWPCYKRHAHGPHEVEAETDDDWNWDCPGVKAHPATMIGGNFKKF